MKIEEQNDIAGKYDVMVCGGGPAGVAAAIAAARKGAKTCLLEVNGCLGGIWTSGMMPWVIDHQNKDGIMKEFREELLEMRAANSPSKNGSLACNIEMLKSYLEQKCVQAGVDVLLHCRVVAAHVEERQIKYVITESKSGREVWVASMFIDTTGDGDLAAFSGCEYDFANPENGLTQPMSMIGLLSGVKLDEIEDVVNGYSKKTWNESKEILRQEILQGGVDPSYGFPTIFYLAEGLFVMMANHQYKVSALNCADVSRATIEGRKEVNDIVKALRSLGGRWKHLQLAGTSEQIGTREGRRIKGLYELKIDDLLDGARFDDAVCECTFGIDVHSTDPDKNKGIMSAESFKTKPYQIPIRSLISKDIDNLMMAGRCISGDFLAHSSYRVTGDAVPMGEAAGIVSAEAAKTNKLPASFIKKN